MDSSPDPLPTAGEPTYPCDRCGKPRTKAEGGTTFTVCDDCWDATMEHWIGTAPTDTPRPIRPTAGEPTLAELCAEVERQAACIEALGGEGLVMLTTEEAARLVDGMREMESQVERMAHQWRLANERANALDSEVTALQSKLADAERERKEIGWAMRNVLAHTGLPPAPTEELLRGLLESVARIARAALTPPAGHATHQEEGGNG